MVGLAGPKQNWRGMTAVDVSRHFGFFVHTNYRHVLEKIMIDHRAAHAERAQETVTLGTPEISPEIFAPSVVAPELVWMPETENLILSKFERGPNPEEAGKERGEGVRVHKKVEREGVQAMVEEGVQKLGEAVKERAENLQVGKAFLQNVKGLFENRKNGVLDQAKNLAEAVLQNVSLGQKKDKKLL